MLPRSIAIASRSLPLPAIAAGAAAVSWLSVLTVLNTITQGSLRATLLYAVPVGLVAWHHWQAGFVLAAIAVTCAWVGGAMPEPGSTQPLWADALVAFGKLTIDAIVAFNWGRRIRTKARAQASEKRADSID